MSWLSAMVYLRCAGSNFTSLKKRPPVCSFDTVLAFGESLFPVINENDCGTDFEFDIFWSSDV